MVTNANAPNTDIIERGKTNMKTINDIIAEIRKTGICGLSIKCWNCHLGGYCHIDSMFIALDYIEREGQI